MYLPSSTYRIQFNSSFKFSDLHNILDYLETLGISTIYSAPIFQSVQNSVHGYDVTNPHVINSEIGTEEEFRLLIERLKEKNMTWLQDIVPNHMAFSSSNPWLQDIFEKGPQSFYYNFFDIDWDYQDDIYVLQTEKGLQGKVMAPFLGEEPDSLIHKGEMKIIFEKGGFFLKYYSLEYKLSINSYCDILAYGKRIYEKNNQTDKESYSRYLTFLNSAVFIRDNFHNLLDENTAESFKKQIHRQYVEDAEIKAIIDYCLEIINQNPSSFQSILDLQYFRLVHWKTSEKKINFRRFFTINDLICLRMEDEKVFDHYHQYIKRLLDDGLIQGLRIDHIDGLKDPYAYTERLRRLVGEDIYIVAEKILDANENLPDFWPLQGATGYEFLSTVNRVFTNNQNKERFSDLYHDLLNKTLNYDDLVFEKKMFFLKEKMGGELNNLLKQLLEIEHHPLHSDIREALAVFLASFSVYRIYPGDGALNEIDEGILQKSLEKAEQRRPELKDSLAFIREVFYKEQSKKALEFVKRSQQFTGPLAAKGIEDTVFYIYNRLISHNEVGDSPELFGSSVSEFHKLMEQRLKKIPYSINATSTHDTKRGEDARMRINVLSELGDEWTSAVFSFREINHKYKKDENIPSENDEYFIYQALIGSYPVNGKTDESFIKRLQDYMIKVAREAKVNTDWSAPSERYEEALIGFIDKILKDRDFLSAFLPLQEKAKVYGVIYSLGQTLLKVTVPGIPDIYQGTELWDLSFVDPDNRRPVDFDLRDEYLHQLKEQKEGVDFTKQMILNSDNGKIKLFTLYNALQKRKQLEQLFLKGEYISLEINGSRANNLIAYIRKRQDQWALVVIPKDIVSISTEEQFGVGDQVWDNTILKMPEHAPKHWIHSFTNETIQLKQVERMIGVPQMVSSDAFLDPFLGNNSVVENQLDISEVLKDFPVALLISHT